MIRKLCNWWTLSVCAALVLGAVLVLGLPIFVTGLRPWWARMLLGGLVALVWAAAAATRIFLARRAEARLASSLSHPVSDEEHHVADRLNLALGHLRRTRSSRDYLYRRPWWLIIGPPGAGKTTALTRSGLRFPHAEVALQGVGGTRDLDFWFADEAVIVDTAGRYTSQDSAAVVDAAGWLAFLEALRRSRPREPVNGVVIALGVDVLLTAQPHEFDAHIDAISRRLEELVRVVDARPPVYLLLTKADLLVGFEAFFEDLDAEGRRAVLGATLPLGTGGASQLLESFDQLTDALGGRLASRLQAEADPSRIAQILAFPNHLARLRAPLARLLDGLARPDGKIGDLIRGVYLGSAVQQGAALDRLLADQGADLNLVSAPRPAAAKAYFLNRLLLDVMLGEAGLVEATPLALRRRRILQGVGGGVIAGALLLALVLWMHAFQVNKSLQRQLLAGAQDARQEIRAMDLDLVEVRDGDPDLEQTLSVLRALSELPRGEADQRAGPPPLAARMGLFQAGHAQAARQAYLVAVQRVMLPRLLLRLETRLREVQGQPSELYEPLKVYLMLGGRGPLDRAAVRAYVVADWEERLLAGDDRAPVRQALTQHLDALLSDPQLGQAWRDGQAPLDGALIDRSRQDIQALSLTERAYAALRQKASAAQKPAWRADAVLTAADARAFANGPAVLNLSTPWFLTREGYQQAYLPGLQTVRLDLERDLWVLGPDADKGAVRAQMSSLRPGVAALYARDYVAAWDRVVSLPQPADYYADPVALGAFARAPSPLKLLMLEVVRNARLSVAKPKLRAPRAVAAAGALIASADGIDAARTIEDHFKPLGAFTGAGDAHAPIDDFVDAVRGAATTAAAAQVAGGGLGGEAVQGQLAVATGTVATSAAAAPPALQVFTGEAARRGRSRALTSARSALGEDYQREVQTSCRAVVDDRYPFYGAAANDAPVGDLLRVFGTGGRMDGFTRQRLAPLLDTEGPVWRWRASDPAAAQLNPGSAEQFQQAAQVSDLLVSGLAMRAELAGVGGGVTSAELTVGGQVARLEAGQPGPRPIVWTLTGLPQARLALYAGRREVRRFEAQGPFALFRLIDQAQKENDGPRTIKASFGHGSQAATLRLAYPGPSNPFSRGGLWSFRCPARP